MSQASPLPALVAALLGIRGGSQKLCWTAFFGALCDPTQFVRRVSDRAFAQAQARLHIPALSWLNDQLLARVQTLVPVARRHRLRVVAGDASALISEDEVRAGFGAGHGATGLVQAQTLDQLLVAQPSKTVFVKVRGESMADAGILSGDVAVVETTSQAVPGDIVVAETDGDCTIKELQVDRHGARLVPHQAGFVSRRPTRTFNVLGVVKGIIRNLANPSPRAKWEIASIGRR